MPLDWLRFSCGVFKCRRRGHALSSPPDGDGGQSGDGDGGIGIDLETIVFERTSTLTLLPTQVAELRVIVEPAERQTVTFDILTDADTFDGFLFEASTKVQDDGIASVSIQAPSMPATFAVRAKMGTKRPSSQFQSALKVMGL